MKLESTMVVALGNDVSGFNSHDLLFLPKPRPELRRIADYTMGLDAGVQATTYLMEHIFLGTRNIPCKQTEWMGRGCFIPVSLRGNLQPQYLTAKGVGPGPGSELMRQLLDDFLRSRYDGQGGCLRLETESYYPILIQFWENHRKWMISDPRPEGFSSFCLLLRDAQSSILLNQLGIRVLLPLLLLRHKLPSPWDEETHIGLERYLLPYFPKAISQYIQERDSVKLVDRTMGMSPHIHKASYYNLDGGILIRQAISPYRVANLHTAIIKKDINRLHYLAHHILLIFNFRKLSKENLWNTSIKFTCLLAQTAAKLFHEGIIHGQLNQHYQNITLAAELADFDCAIFTRAIAKCAKDIPFSSSASLEIYKKFLEHMRHTSSQLNIDPIQILYKDYKNLAGIGKYNVNEAMLASSMLGQVYDLYNHSLRVADILNRICPLSLEHPGTILSKDEYDSIQSHFKGVFIQYLSQERSELLLSWALKRGYNYLVDTISENLGKHSIYGWSKPGVPVNDSSFTCDPIRLSYILREIEILFRRD